MSAHIPTCGCLQRCQQHTTPVALHVRSSTSSCSRRALQQSRVDTCRLPGAAVQQRGHLQVVSASRRRGSLPKEARVPDGYVDYETMLLLRPDLTEEERDIELAKFEAFLERQAAKDVNAMVRGVTQLAYPIKGFWEGIYVLYTYTARRSTSVKVQSQLATPPVGEERRVLRFATFCM